jgi:hypothetical protein
MSFHGAVESGVIVTDCPRGAMRCFFQKNGPGSFNESGPFLLSCVRGLLMMSMHAVDHFLDGGAAQIA